MAPQLLFYERAVPISAQTHRDVSVEARLDYAFARHTNVVPITAAEMSTAVSEYAIVFVGQGDDVLPVVVVGIRDAQNAFVTDAGRWDAAYVPAFVRRYPFVFASGQPADRLMLCIDEASGLINRDGRGARLFEDNGDRTRYLEEVLQFMQQYQLAFQRSQQFARRLAELGLLQPVQAKLRGPDGEHQLRGFMRVDRDKLKALNADIVHELFRTDGLEIIYLHLASIRNLERLAQRALGGGTPAQSGDEVDGGDILLS